ncbi:MAG: response regulator transcription factor [Clostridium sp.]|nr:response regulator transcription factor [Clostridium sp.]
MRLLIAEDEKELNRVLVKRLEGEHYTVDACYDGDTALDYIRMAEYDAIILDIMMPGKDGMQALKQLRSEGIKAPVLLLTARDGIEDRVAGLDLGADDYLVKPFAFDELLARIRVMLRRISDHVSNRYELADLSVDCDSHRVFRGEREITLSSKEFSVLEYMIRNKGIVLSREKIEAHIWNYEYAGGSNVVDVYIRYLRKKIDEGSQQKLIHTIRGAGYVLKVEE